MVLIKPGLCSSILVFTAIFVMSAFANAAEIESMTDEQLLEEVRKENKFNVAGFHMPDDFGVAIADGELWQHLLTDSVSSVADAENEIKSFVSAQKTDEHTFDFIGENAYYYEFRLKYTREREADNSISMRVVVYKESAMFCAFNDKTGYKSEIRALDAGSVLSLTDLDTFFNTINWDSARVVHREFKEADTEYVYTYYRVSITDGDWDLNARAVLEKIKYGIDRTTGVKTYYDDNKVLITVEIPGTAKKGIVG